MSSKCVKITFNLAIETIFDAFEKEHFLTHSFIGYWYLSLKSLFFSYQNSLKPDKDCLIGSGILRDKTIYDGLMYIPIKINNIILSVDQTYWWKTLITEGLKNLIIIE